MHVNCSWNRIFLLNLLVYRGYKVGRSKDEKIQDSIYLIKYVFYITLSTMFLVLLGLPISFGMAVILIITFI